MAAAEAPVPSRGGKRFLLRRGRDHVQEARKLFPPLSPPPSLPPLRVPGGCHPRSSKVNLIQKPRDLVSRFPRALSFSFSLFWPPLPPRRCPGVPKALAAHSRSSPISVAVPRLVVEICPYLLYSSAAACACAARCIVGIHRVQCKNCAPGTFAEEKILNQRLRHLPENAIRDCCIV